MVKKVVLDSVVKDFCNEKRELVGEKLDLEREVIKYKEKLDLYLEENKRLRRELEVAYKEIQVLREVMEAKGLLKEREIVCSGDMMVGSIERVI